MGVHVVKVPYLLPRYKMTTLEPIDSLLWALADGSAIKQACLNTGISQKVLSD